MYVCIYVRMYLCMYVCFHSPEDQLRASRQSSVYADPGYSPLEITVPNDIYQMHLLHS